MKIRNCSAILILALLFSCAIDASGPLAALVRAFRESPTPAHRSAINAYTSTHPKDTALANLALGIAAYEQHNYAAAIPLLQPLAAQLPAVADYAAYYLAAARVENAEYDSITRDLAPIRRAPVASPFVARSWILEARALKTSDAAAAVRVLTEHYTELPQPDGDIALADSYQAAGDVSRAAEYYQRVYYSYISGDAATRAAAALLTLKDAMGASYPRPAEGLQCRRAERLLDAREYVKARGEYSNIPGDLARVGVGAADYLRGDVSVAGSYLRNLTVSEGEADAQRLYYLAECARRNSDDAALQSALQRLAALYPKSPWRLRALSSAANRYLLVNRPDDFVPLYRAIYQDFPTSATAPLAHWKVTFQAWLRNQADAPVLLREHLHNYPTHFTAGGSLYFLGRSFEQAHDYASARACYQRLAGSFENQYYAMLGRARLRSAEIATAPPSSISEDFLSAIRFTGAPPVPTRATPPTSVRIERSRLLRSAGLNDLADAELRFGARRDGQPVLLAMELAECADATHQAMRLMKVMSPEYLQLPIASAPRKYWELLFPLPYRSDLVSSAHARNIDPFLLAGLIRQESEFNPQAVSPAKAYGLTQIRPVTGRQFARRAGVPAFNTRILYQPGANLKIGSSILKSMLDSQGGSLEQTLAAYNAGPARVSEWLTWANYREPAEFVESIPFTETRDYVQAVMRNAEMYRRLYDR
jgi:soluble lytic murein transglycosylase